MDHLISVRAALKAASVNGTPPPVLAIPIPGHAPVCIRTQLLKGALTPPADEETNQEQIAA